MQTIAIVNEKGGTGKTTTAVNLAAALGAQRRSVLLVDLDGQAASSRWLGVEDDTSFADALWRGSDLKPVPDVIPGVSLAPGHGKLDTVAHDLRPTQGGQLRRLLSELAGFDYALIDCPPSLGNRLIGNALLAATHAIVPVETSILALDGLKILLTTLDDVREGFGHDIILAGVLAVRFDVRTNLSRLVLQELKRALPSKVFNTVIRETVRMRECPASGESILTYAPKSHAAEDYMNLALEVLDSPNCLPARADEGDDVRPEDASLRAELSEKERTAVEELRGMAAALVRRGGRKPSRQTDVPAPPTAAGVSGEPTEPEVPTSAQPSEAATPAPAEPGQEDHSTGAEEAVEAGGTGLPPSDAESRQPLQYSPPEPEAPADEPAAAGAPTPTEPDEEDQDTRAEELIQAACGARCAEDEQAAGIVVIGPDSEVAADLEPSATDEAAMVTEAPAPAGPNPEDRFSCEETPAEPDRTWAHAEDEQRPQVALAEPGPQATAEPGPLGSDDGDGAETPGPDEPAMVTEAPAPAGPNPEDRISCEETPAEPDRTWAQAEDEQRPQVALAEPGPQTTAEPGPLGSDDWDGAETPGPDEPDKQEDQYPALRAMLREKTGKADPGSARGGKKHGRWRRFIGKTDARR